MIQPSQLGSTRNGVSEQRNLQPKKTRGALYNVSRRATQPFATYSSQSLGLCCEEHVLELFYIDFGVI